MSAAVGQMITLSELCAVALAISCFCGIVCFREVQKEKEKEKEKVSLSRYNGQENSEKT